LLKQQKFDDLDCIGHAARREKTRLPGGLWKLHNIYIGLTEPTGHATEEDWTERISLLQKWVTAKPNSITARVALAEAYDGYAWDARGNGYSNTVTDSGWKLFNQRLEQGKAILDEAAGLPEKCPEIDLQSSKYWQTESKSCRGITAFYFCPLSLGMVPCQPISALLWHRLLTW
jgi:hypothetical protein